MFAIFKFLISVAIITGTPLFVMFVIPLIWEGLKDLGSAVMDFFEWLFDLIEEGFYGLVKILKGKEKRKVFVIEMPTIIIKPKNSKK
jgi:hypothetical protein